jgi:cytoskeletal protein CcmA (bactofilin family)
MKLVKTEEIENPLLGLIGRGVAVSGDIKFIEGLRIEGRVAGSVVSENGTLVIEEGAQVEAKVEVGICIISGNLQGDVTAKSRIEIRRTSRVNGDVTAPVLLIEEGAMFNGSVGMTRDEGRRLESSRATETSDMVKVKGA